MQDGKAMTKTMLMAGICAFVFVFLFEFLVHGFLMKGPYEATMHVWRPESEANMPLMLLSQLLFSLAVAFFYPVVGSNKDCDKAIPFGFGLGLVMAMPQLATHSYLPIPLSISLMWAGAAFAKALGTGIIVGKVFSRRGC